MRLALILGLVLLTGCVGPTRLPSYPRAMPAAESATVIVFREDAALGAIVNFTVLLDGVEIAELDRRHLLEFQVAPGTHSVSSQGGSLALEYKAGERVALRISPLWTGGAQITKVPLSEVPRFDKL